MIQIKTKLNISDNSGAILAECIKTYRFSKKNNAVIGDYILGSIKKASTGRKVKKSQLHRILVIQESRPIIRKDGTQIRLNKTAGILLKDYIPVGTRIDNLIPIEIRMRGYIKVVSMAPIII